MALPASLGLERRNPLPRGRYWVFRIGPKDIVAFDAWITKWRKQRALAVRSSELDPGETTATMTSFVVFEVLTDGVVIWDQPGLPDRAPAHVTSSDDVIQAPKLPEPGFDAVADTMRKAEAAITRGSETLPTLLFFAGVLYLLTRGSSES